MRQIIGDLKNKIERAGEINETEELARYSAAIRDLSISMYLYTRVERSIKKIDKEAENIARRHSAKQPAKEKTNPELFPGTRLFFLFLCMLACFLFGILLGHLFDGFLGSMLGG